MEKENVQLSMSNLIKMKNELEQKLYGINERLWRKEDK